VLLGSLIETQNRGRYLSYRFERRYRAILHGQASPSLDSREWVSDMPTPSTDAADTSSNTLRSQRENIAAVEVER
jgi:hypothetical protein